MAYEHLFFDLDHTLWDFERNSTETLRELFAEYEFKDRFEITIEEFLKVFVEVNNQLWSQYNVGKIDRAHIRGRRFDLVFDALDAPKEDRPADLSEIYVSRCPHKPHTLPHTFETLDYLQAKGYALHIITNGFDDVQAIKLNVSGLAKYFDLVVTSETSGHKKPAPGIFHHALETAKAPLEASLMIGDNLETDIHGAQKVNLDQVFFNPHKQEHNHAPTFEIHSLDQMRSFL